MPSLRPRKPCVHCGGVKEPGRARRWCDTCLGIYQEQRADRNRVGSPLYNFASRRRALRVLYGISLADYDAILATQQNACAICKKPATDEHLRRRSLHVDHDHQTGVVRGILCLTCNAGISYLEREPWRQAADAYLARVCEPLLAPREPQAVSS